MIPATATAHSNIALVKYWGKRAGVDPELNLPAVSSLSLTLDELRSETTVAPAAADSFRLDGAVVGGSVALKVSRHLDRVWAAGGATAGRPAAAVDSTNHLPTAAGLASSASGFAALTVAAAAAFELDLAAETLSELARRGSGSAARSLWGGFVRLDRGERLDGADCRARPLFPASHWDVRLLIAETTRGAKKLGSTAGMESCRLTSPYYAAWIDTSEADLEAATAAITARDLGALGPVMEHSCFKMHACMAASRPAILYWNPTTLAVVQRVLAVREQGLAGYITIDAGPHVKVLCLASDADALAGELRALPGVLAVRSLAPGPDAHVQVSGRATAGATGAA